MLGGLRGHQICPQQEGKSCLNAPGPRPVPLLVRSAKPAHALHRGLISAHRPHSCPTILLWEPGDPSGALFLYDGWTQVTVVLGPS